jgi:transcriptional regulator with XRE-family HTH domain
VDEQQARDLGRTLRRRREELGLSLRNVADRSGVPNNSILHIEQGSIASPAPDKLARIADALGMSLADVFAVAGWAVPADLPHFRPYLRTKYQGLPDEDIAAIERYAARLAKKHGISLSGPAPGEDE